MPTETWDSLRVDATPIEPGSAVCLGFDGSTSGDATALVAYEVARQRLVVLGLWERPTGRRDWAVPRDEVMATIDVAFARYEVLQMFMDPWWWRSEAESLAQRHGEKVMSWNTGAVGRMAPASDAFLTAATTGNLMTDGNERLRAHMLSAIARRTPIGDVIVKDARRPQRIDLAVASILALEAARTFVPDPVGDYAIW